MKKIFIFIILILTITGCTAIQEFNKKLENINKSLPTHSGTTSSSSEVINLVADTRGKGKFENAKVTIKPSDLDPKSREVILSGYYTNTTKSYQSMVKIEVDVKDKDGDIVNQGSFSIQGINAGEKVNFSKSTHKLGKTYFLLGKDQYIDRKSWRVNIFN